jgi:hypothetical protein
MKMKKNSRRMDKEAIVRPNAARGIDGDRAVAATYLRGEGGLNSTHKRNDNNAGEVSTGRAR